MMKIQSANQLSGRAIGSIFFAAFGAIWLILALYAKEMLSVASVSSVALGLAILLAGAVYLLRQAKHWPSLPDDPANDRAFKWINIVQWVAVAIVAFTFAKLHIDAYVLSAITAIVGIHMFPLGRLLRYPMHYVTGALLVAWAVASAVLVPTETMLGTAALGTGMILWVAAGITQWMALVAARQSAATVVC
jgi:hypothetical protein